MLFQDVVPKYPTTCEAEWVDSEDPLFLLYTSGSTGKPKVVMLHGLIKTCPFPDFCSNTSL